MATQVHYIPQVQCSKWHHVSKPTSHCSWSNSAKRHWMISLPSML